MIKSACALHNFLTEDMPIAAIVARLNPDQEPYLGRDGAMQPIDHLPSPVSICKNSLNRWHILTGADDINKWRNSITTQLK